MWPIVDEQLERALALKPTHLSFNGGGNDMLRPRTSLAAIVEAFDRVRARCAQAWRPCSAWQDALPRKPAVSILALHWGHG